jgi:poly(A) polymerase
MNARPFLDPQRCQFLQSPGLKKIFSLIESAGGEVRINGGAVRNAILGESVNDIDLSTTLLPEHASDCLMRGNIKIVPTGIEHGTITAIFEGKAFEITTLREDIVTDGRHAIVRFGTDWHADAMRRDFTINALYCDLAGRIYDPLNAYADLMARNVRFIGDPDQRIQEDRLRILRFFRFFAWYGKQRPDAESLKACVRHKDGLEHLSAERVWHELKRLLSAPDPVRALLWMRTSHILSLIVPESAKWGIDLVPPIVKQASNRGEKPDPVLRLMAMIPPEPEKAQTLARRLKLSNEESRRLENRASTPVPDLQISRQALAELLYRHGQQTMLDHLRLENARLEHAAQSSPGQSWDQSFNTLLDFAISWQRPRFPVTGGDLIAAGYSPGPQMGRLLRQLETQWVNSGFKLDRSELLQFVDSDQNVSDSGRIL